MPFSEKTSLYPKGYFDEVLKHLITPAAVRANFNARTAKKAGSEVIQSTIVNDLDAADLVIVDLTEHNPNVLFELGMKIAFNKPVCLIRARGTPAIFDIDHMLRVRLQSLPVAIHARNRCAGTLGAHIGDVEEQEQRSIILKHTTGEQLAGWSAKHLLQFKRTGSHKKQIRARFSCASRRDRG